MSTVYFVFCVFLVWLQQSYILLWEVQLAGVHTVGNTSSPLFWCSRDVTALYNTSETDPKQTPEDLLYLTGVMFCVTCFEACSAKVQHTGMRKINTDNTPAEGLRYCGPCLCSFCQGDICKTGLCYHHFMSIINAVNLFTISVFSPFWSSCKTSSTD